MLQSAWKNVCIFGIFLLFYYFYLFGNLLTHIFAVEKVDWTSKEETAQEFLGWIIDLVSFNGCYIPSSFNLLVQGFIPIRKEAGMSFSICKVISSNRIF